jgi:AcrR family transcriptional regulator
MEDTMITLNAKTLSKKTTTRPTTGMMHKISLRQRKHAQTKVSLARAAMERMREKRLDEISVKELCETIPISEVTFYNYFPQKTDLLIYVMQLWRLEMDWKLQNQEGEKSNIEIIENFFDIAGRTFEEYPLVMNEALAFFIQKREDECFGEMSIAERLVAYPELPGIEHVQIPRNPKKDNALLPFIRKAIEAEELPGHLSVKEISDMLDVIFIGALMNFHKDDSIRIRPVFQKMLKVLWHGLRSGVLDKNHAEQAD